MRPPWFATRLRVAPSSARVYRVGDEVAGCPAASVHWLCRRWSFEYPRISHALSAAGLRDTPGLPWILTPPCNACRSETWVAPCSDASGLAGDGVPSRPGSRIFRRCRQTEIRVAPAFRPSVSPTIRGAGCPASRIFRLRLVVSSQIAPGADSIRFCHGSEPRVAPLLTPLTVPVA